MGKITDALRKLGTKLTGKPTIESNNIATVLNDIANDYDGDQDTKYTAGTGIEITSGNVINNTQNDVVANPTLAGTEANLTGLQVGDTKFKVGGGSEQHLYLHRIAFSLSGNASYFIQVIGFVLNSSNTPLVAYDEETGLYNVEELLSLDYDYLTIILTNLSNETLISSQPFTAFDYDNDTKQCHFDCNGGWIEDSSDTIVWGYSENDSNFSANEEIIQKL